MLNRYTSLGLVIALVLTLGGPSAFADPLSDPKTTVHAGKTQSKFIPAASDEAQPNEKLKAEVLGLVAAARAGKTTPRSHPQSQTIKGNHLSTTVKIAIVVGIVVLVLAIIVISQKDNLFDCRSRCVL